MKNSIIILLLLTLLYVPAVAQDSPFTGTVTSVNSSSYDLSLPSLTALAESDRSNSDIVWVGYQITARKSFNSLRNHYQVSSSGHHGYFNGRYSVSFEGSDEGIEVKSSPEKAVLLKFKRTGGNMKHVDILIYDLNEQISFTKPLLWMGAVDQNRSLDLMKQCWNAGDENLQENIIPAIALHPQEQALQQLESYATSKIDDDLREDAVSWYGMSLTESDFARFDALFRKLDKADLREDALFIFFRFESDKAVERLFEVAEKDPGEDVREQAIFWLGQRAGKFIAKKMGVDPSSCEEMTSDQKAKIFALHQMDNAKGREMLLRVVEKGKTYDMRKTALFWLCTEPDSRTLKMLRELMN